VDGEAGMSDFAKSFEFMADHLSLLTDKTWEHIVLSVVAIAISLLIAIPLGAWLGHLHRGSFLAINVSNVGRALPSLAVIAIMMGLLGLGFANVTVALVVLAVPPMLTNAYVAVDGVDRDAVEAARGMGMTPLEVFRRVELPLSVPLMFAGIRTAAVYVIATATLAAIAGGGGLGDVIVNQASYGLPGVLAGAMWVAALALVADAGFGALQRAITPRGLREEPLDFDNDPGGNVHTRPIRATLVAIAVLALSLGAAACGDDDKGAGDKPPITIGSKSFTEQTILGQLYTQALKAKGYKVTLKANIGQTEIADKALTSGQVDMYPEYTGTTLSVVAGAKTKPKSAEDAYAEAKKFYEGRGQTLTEPTPFSNSDGIATEEGFATQNGLKAIPDLEGLGSKVTLAGAPEFATREEGLLGLKKTYGLTDLKFKPLQIGLQYKALDSGDVNAIEVFTTDGQLASGKYTVLEDPQNVFGFQNVAMVVPQKLLDDLGSEFEDTVNGVSSKLTNEAMQKMNAAVDIDKNSPADVARQFLEANDLLKG
jgi:glycine betaine/choline ABC-type transport system substrate-binding protein/ABC-type proline/glycine betaine transport system permease subunit